MSKGNSGYFHNTKGYIIDIISSLPPNPNKLVKRGWIETTNPSQAENSSSRSFVEPKSGIKVRFDAGKEGSPGLRGKDHYHVENPNSTCKGDKYLTKDGEPTQKILQAHILFRMEIK